MHQKYQRAELTQKKKNESLARKHSSRKVNMEENTQMEVIMQVYVGYNWRANNKPGRP